MTSSLPLEQPDEVATKVLRRAQVSKMTRALQDRLALANVKIQNGWENMSLDAIEPQVEERLRRKRPASSHDTMSDTASTVSSRVQSNSVPGSSPLTAPMFSDDFQRSGSGYSNKKIRPMEMQMVSSSGAATVRRKKIATTARKTSWKKDHNLFVSSPISHTKHARFPSHNISSLSFISEGSTVADDPPSPEFSEDDDADLPVHSFNQNITSSPPHTPPPDRRMRKANNIAWSRTPKTGEEGADLLMYLAKSPGQGQPRDAKPSSTLQPPRTPPCKSTPLPSSHMTPGMGGAGFLSTAPQTPGTNFNFADFVNVTPSPAQGPWTRTPAAKTPGTAKEARRKLNFDHSMPHGLSPTAVRSHPTDASSMDLGGELVSSQ